MVFLKRKITVISLLAWHLGYWLVLYFSSRIEYIVYSYIMILIHIKQALNIILLYLILLRHHSIIPPIKILWTTISQTTGCFLYVHNILLVYKFVYINKFEAGIEFIHFLLVIIQITIFSWSSFLVNVWSNNVLYTKRVCLFCYKYAGFT